MSYTSNHVASSLRVVREVPVSFISREAYVRRNYWSGLALNLLVPTKRRHLRYFFLRMIVAFRSVIMWKKRAVARETNANLIGR